MPPVLPLLYCAALVAAVTLACAIAPACDVNRMQPAAILSAESNGGGFARSRGRNSLVVAQVAVCFMFLSGAFMLLRGLVVSRLADPGFDVAHTMAVSVWRPRVEAALDDGASSFNRVRDIAKHVPGVESVTSARYLPLWFPLTVFGPQHASVRTAGNTGTRLDVDVYAVGPNFLDTMGIPILRGRDLTDRDLPGRGRPMTAVVVNEAFVRRLFVSDDPVGRQMVMERGRGQPLDRPLEIVGLARDSKVRSLNETPRPVVYLPDGGSWYIVRTAGPSFALVRMVEQAIIDADRTASVSAQPMTRQLASQLLPMQIGTGVLAALSGLGLLLAMTGLYAVVNYAVRRRTFEIGVRIALGARRGALLWMVLRDGLRVVAIGCTIGALLTGALAITARRALGAAVLGPQGSFDVVALVGAAASLLAVGGAATLWPARRAARVDPAVALRHS